MFKLNRKNDFEYYTIPLFEETGLVRHGFTTKSGGVSAGCYSSMNLRFNSEDSLENVHRNFRIATEMLGMEYDRLVLTHQVHEDVVHTVEESDIGNGILFENKFSSADGLITDKRNVPIVAFFADCVPILFLDRRLKIIAAVHSGWKGTVKRIGQKAVRKMKNTYGSRAEDILVGIGPSIGECHFEVGDEVAEKFIEEFGEDSAIKYDEKYHVNMQRAIRIQLEEEGVRNIDDCGICTYCNSDRLFSHRKTNGKRGVMGAFIELA